MRTAGTAPIPPFSIIHASIIQPIATKEPTLISIPPVIMTIVMPIPMTIRPALEIKRFKKFPCLGKALCIKEHAADRVHHEEQQDRDKKQERVLI